MKITSIEVARSKQIKWVAMKSILIYYVFKPGACRPKASQPGFLKLLLSGKSVCVSAPQAIYNHSHEMKPQ